MEDVSVNENGEPLGITPDTPTRAEPTAEAPAPTAPMEPAPTIATSSVPAEPWPAPVVPEPLLAEPVMELAPEPTEPAPSPEPAPAPAPEPAPAEQLTIETAEAVAPIAVVADAEIASAGFMTEGDVADGLTGQLQALSESLGEPADELATAEGEAAPYGVAELVEQPAEGAEAAVEAPEGAEATAEAATAEGDTAAGVEPATESLDDIAPGTVTVAAVEESADAVLDEVEAPRTTVSWWPFIGYVLVWLGAAGYAVWQLEALPIGQAAYETTFYSTAMLVGLSLLAAGPVLILIVWLASWIGRKGARIGLMFISALVKGAAATLIGAMIWIGALLLIDYLRLGRPF